MTTVPLGTSAYLRLYSGEPPVVLLNRWLERNPANLREHTTLLARPGTTPQITFPIDGYTGGLGTMRGNYALEGLFSDSLFVVCGETLYRVNADMSVTTIVGVLQGTGYPEVAWQKGIGYERLFITDGLNLYFYGGTSQAKGTLTGTVTTQTIQLGSTYYQWVAAITGGAGTVGNPWQVSNVGDPFANLIAALTAGGTPGTTYSTGITVPNGAITATGDGNTPVVTVNLAALQPGSAGNSLITVVTSGTGLTFSHGTLQNGGIDALQGVSVPDGVSVTSLSQVSGYVTLSVQDLLNKPTQQFYWINPGEVIIDALNFASKESSPDPIVSLRAVGDQLLVMGEKSTENWYATGDLTVPFAPIEGRVYQRGSIPGTTVVVGDAVVLVGDDGRVYSVGYQYTENVSWGVQRISDNGLEERIRRQVRREQGLQP